MADVDLVLLSSYWWLYWGIHWIKTTSFFCLTRKRASSVVAGVVLTTKLKPQYERAAQAGALHDGAEVSYDYANTRSRRRWKSSDIARTYVHHHR